MPTRTFKLTGEATGAADITVVFNGSQVFTGAVGTDGTLCEFTADGSVTGNTTTTVTVNSGTEINVAGLQANHVIVAHPEYLDGEGNTVEEVTADDVASHFDYLNDADGIYGSSALSSNASINGNEITVDGDMGVWHFTLTNGDVLAVDYYISAIPS